MKFFRGNGLAASLNKKQVIDRINEYLKNNLEDDKQRAVALLIKADPKFRGLFINPFILKKLRIELKALMKTVAFEYSIFLKSILKNYFFKNDDVLPAARAALKCHQKIIIANFIQHLREKNPKHAHKLDQEFNEFPDLMLPTVRKNNAKAFETIHSKKKWCPKLFASLRKFITFS